MDIIRQNNGVAVEKKFEIKNLIEMTTHHHDTLKQLDLEEGEVVQMVKEKNELDNFLTANTPPFSDDRKALEGLLLFFEIGYRICFTPFKIVGGQGAGGQDFVLYRSRLQMFFYTFIILSAFIGCTTTVKGYRAREMRQNSCLYFQLVSSLGTFAQQLCRTYMILLHPQWVPKICNLYLRRRAENLKLFEASTLWRRRTSTLKTTTTRTNMSWLHVTPKKFTFLLLLVMILFYIPNHWGNPFNLKLVTSWSHFESQLRAQKNSANDLLRPLYEFDMENLDPMTCPEAVFLIYIMFCKFVIRFTYLLSDALFLVIFNFYGQLVDDLVHHVQKDEGATQASILNQFRLLQALVAEVNQGAGVFMAAAVLGNLPHFVHKIPSLMQNFDADNAILAFYSAYFFGGLFYAARKFTKLEMCMRRWVMSGRRSQGGTTRNHNNGGIIVSRDDDVDLLFELQWNHHMGLSMGGMHEINQGLLTSVISAVIAYSIIVIQFEEQPV